MILLREKNQEQLGIELEKKEFPTVLKKMMAQRARQIYTYLYNFKILSFFQRGTAER